MARRRLVNYAEILTRKFRRADGRRVCGSIKNHHDFSTIVWTVPNDKDNPSKEQCDALRDEIQAELDLEYCPYDKILDRRFRLPDGRQSFITIIDTSDYETIEWTDPEVMQPTKEQCDTERTSVIAEMDEEWMTRRQRGRFEGDLDRRTKALECLVDVLFDVIDGQPILEARRIRLQKLRDRLDAARRIIIPQG